MRISYNSWAAYKECPRKFLLQYVKKARPTEPVNEYNTLYGKLIGKYFEMYCNVWRYKTPYLFPDIIRERMEKLFDKILHNSVVDWAAPGCSASQADILNQACKDACTIMESPTLNYFLATKSEVSIEIKLNSGHIISGRLDFIHTNLDKSIIILDGKGGKHVGRNVDRNQLYFYALLHQLHYKAMPSEVGFFYYRFNTFEPLTFNLDLLNEFRAQLSLDIKAITGANTFEPAPTAKACKYCKYLSGCVEGTKAKASRAKSSKIDMDGEGIMEFGL